MTALAALAVVAAAALDALVGELPEPAHPVAWFGAAVAAVDREWLVPGIASIVIAVAFPILAAVVVALVVAAGASLHVAAGAMLAGVVLFGTTSRRLLVGLAREVVAATDGDLEDARASLRGLAGRDASELSPALVRSAAVESAAENLADGLVAPLLAFLVGLPFGFAAAAGAAAWVKAVNTLDSMLGYPDKPHGTASARLDDVSMWIPARASAALVAIAAARPRAVLAARSWLASVPSPNSGWPMGALAAGLDVRLEKPGVYVLDPSASLPSVAVAERAIGVVDCASWLAFAIAAAIALLVPVPADGFVTVPRSIVAVGP